MPTKAHSRLLVLTLNICGDDKARGREQTRGRCSELGLFCVLVVLEKSSCVGLGSALEDCESGNRGQVPLLSQLTGLGPCSL